MLLTDLEESILKVQEISKTERCTVQVGIKGARHFSTFQLQDTGGAKRVTTDSDGDDGLIFAGCSLFKVFIAVALSVMIEKLSVSSEPANIRYAGLKNAWKRTFTAVFNECSEDFKIQDLRGNPKVRDLIFHFKGLCDINHLLLAPDSSPLLSKTAFLDIIPQYSEDIRQEKDEAWCEYSNGNYILISLFIEIVSGKSLAECLKEYVFKPLGMNRTYMSSEELSSVPNEKRVKPHIVSGNGLRRTLDLNEIPFLSDTVEIAALGGYTCAADIGIFFEAVLEGLYGESSNSIFDKAFCRSLFKGMGKLEGEKELGYTRFGLFTTLNENLPGSHSLNRLKIRGSGSSSCILGNTAEDKELEVYYMAGCATGWLNTVYFIPRKRVYIIALTNTSGPLDMSDIVSRLCLQEIFRLRPLEIGGQGLTFEPEGWKDMSLEEVHRAFYVELAAAIYKENAHAFQELEKEDSAPDTPTADCLDALGTYENKKSAQFIDVIDLDGTLGIRLRGESKTSKPMRFVRKSNVFRICSRLRGTTDLGIDCFGDWRELEFTYEEKNGEIVCFIRKGSNLVDRFTRVVS